MITTMFGFWLLLLRLLWERGFWELGQEYPSASPAIINNHTQNRGTLSIFCEGVDVSHYVLEVFCSSHM